MTRHSRRAQTAFRFTAFWGVACVSSLFTASPAAALEVFFQWGTGSLTILDNFAGDNNVTPGIIDFGPIILPDYTVSGTVDLGSGPNLSSVIGTPSASLRLTNFLAEASTIPQFPLRVGMRETLTGTYSNLIGGDAIDAYVGNSFGSAVPVGQDELQFWQGYLGILTFPPPFGPNPPIPNPLLPANSSPLPYPTYGHGPYALPGSYTNPLLGADLYFYLGGQGDQFILQSSAEVGVRVVPEPGTLGLSLLGCVAIFATSYFGRNLRNT